MLYLLFTWNSFWSGIIGPGEIANRQTRHKVSAGASLPLHPGPPACAIPCLDVLYPQPRWTDSGAFAGCLPGSCCLPRNPGGSASTTSLSRPVQASHTLPPFDSLPHPKRGCPQGFGTSPLPNRTACQHPCQPASARLGLVPTRWSHPSGRTRRMQTFFSCSSASSA